MRNWLHAIERKLYRYNIPPIMKYLVFAMGGVFVLDLALAMSTAYTTRFSLIGFLSLDVSAVLRGQIWRLITWLAVPLNSSPIWILVSLYFYYTIGTALENRWGARRFLIYFAIGAIANVLAAFLTYAIRGYGYGTNSYLYLSLFIAFAALYPDMQFMMFYVIPVKAKWLAVIDLVFFLSAILFGSTWMRWAAIASLVNVALFFGQDIYRTCHIQYSQWKRRRMFRQ